MRQSSVENLDRKYSSFVVKLPKCIIMCYIIYQISANHISSSSLPLRHVRVTEFTHTSGMASRNIDLILMFTYVNDQ